MEVAIFFGVAAAVVAIGWLVTWFRKRPEKENDTMREAERRAAEAEEEQQERERAERERDRCAAELEKMKKELEKMEELERKRKERDEEKQREDKQRKEEKEEKEKKSEEQERQRSKRAEKEADQPTTETEVTAQEYDLVRQRQVLIDCEARMKATEHDLEKTKLAHETERAARKRLEKGEQPIKWPTMAEIQHAREYVQYNPNNIHFAIVGKSGSGKSSLINAFLNLRTRDSGAAATGVTETTATIGRYQDPGQQDPRPWTVWYDVPGAGTQNCPAWQYFINQGLFVFDVILIAIGDRFEETDVQLLRDCHRFKIPALIVRSKADMHIENLMKEEDDGCGEPVDKKLYQRCRDTFITESKQMVRNQLAQAGLDGQKVYLVSSYTLRQVYNRSLDGLDYGSPPKMIDEQALIQDLMFQTVQRRGDNSPAFQAGLQLVARGVNLFPSFTMYLRIIQLMIAYFIYRLPS